jgi:hypothetical protein
MKTPYVNLINIDGATIDQKYNFIVYQEKNKNESKKKNLLAKTKISDITKDVGKNAFFSYIDEAKKDHICVVTMKDVVTEQKLPVKTNLSCFWCRHSFPYQPIGCPISYKCTRLFKKYYSEITKNNYCLQENISSKQFEDCKYPSENNFFSLELEPANFYMTDGMFCSFNCCFAFIRYNKANPLYTQSENLLKKIYFDMFSTHSIDLSPAPHWRLLQNYGGDLSIEDFRKTFYKIEFLDQKDYTNIFPLCKPVGFIFEKKIKL